MNENAIEKFSKLLSMKFWFGGKMVYPWEHPMNRIKNCVAITLDGCLQYKFKLCKNSKLRLMKASKHGRYLALGIKPLQTVTLDELYVRIGGNPNDFAGSFLQLTSPVPIPVNMAELREVETIRRKCKSYALPLKPDIKVV
jgi:hypothetical protein